MDYLRYNDNGKYFDFVFKILKTQQVQGKYFPLPCSFDIETTNKNKHAYMYIWQFSINNQWLVYGRTWDEFFTFINRLIDVVGINENKRLYVGVHNLSYEWAFIQKRFEWSKVFATTPRKPIYAITTTGIEFQCTYLMSGRRLADLGTATSKLTYDYDKQRTSTTPLTEDELSYCMTDVIIVVEYLQRQLKTYNAFSKIPRTITGVVRNYIKKEVKNDNINCFQPTDKAEIDLQIHAFQGGFTHSNPYRTGDIYNDVTGYDLTSAYPSVMLAERYPYGNGTKCYDITTEKILNDQEHSYIFLIEFKGLKNVFEFDSYISLHKCIQITDYIEYNGRVHTAKKLTIALCNVDLEIIAQVYTWDDYKIYTCYRYELLPLPISYFKAIDYFYQVKTEYKGIEEKHDEYMRCKGMLNSLYGMCALNTFKPLTQYVNGEWLETPQEFDDIIRKQQQQKHNYTSYIFAIFITAYVRRIIWDFILIAQEDYIYTDTDSIEILNGDKYLGHIEKHNRAIQDKIQDNYKYYNLPYKVYQTIKGVPKPLGVWDFEFSKAQFKTLGAKRYLIKHSTGEYEVAVAGAPKNAILSKISDDPFTYFNSGLYLTPLESGKLCSTYDDEYYQDFIEGELMCECSGVSLNPTEFTMTMSVAYEGLLQIINNTREALIWRKKNYTTQATK